MVHITDVLPNFGTLKEYRDFLDTLVEKQTSGQEIARGMDKHDKSKEQKKQQVLTKEVKKNANGSSSEKHYDHIDPNVEQSPAAPPVPLEPGRQVNIGNKTPDSTYDKPKTVNVDVSGEQDKIELKPKVDILNNRLS